MICIGKGIRDVCLEEHRIPECCDALKTNSCFQVDWISRFAFYEHYLTCVSIYMFV